MDIKKKELKATITNECLLLKRKVLDVTKADSEQEQLIAICSVFSEIDEINKALEMMSNICVNANLVKTTSENT